MRRGIVVLFTGSGRHRRKTQAEKAIAVAGVTGVGLALPLLAVSGAHAAPVHTWDKVADCASGGDWTLNKGDGYFGGLQLTTKSWESYGGTQYAARADLATKSQQIAVAERVLAAEGAEAWSDCGLKAHLTQGGKPGEEDTNDPATGSGSLKGNKGVASVNSAPDGTPQTPDKPAVPVFPGQGGWDAKSGVYWYLEDGHWYWTSHEDIYQQRLVEQTAAQVPQTTAPTDAATGDPAATTAPATAQAQASADGAAPHGKATGQDGDSQGADAQGADNQDHSASALSHTPAGQPGPQTTAPSPVLPESAAPQSQAPQTPAPQTAEQPAAAQPAAAQPAAPQAYTVHHGDTLSGIAADQKVHGGWTKLYEQNQQVVGQNPDLIVPGQVLDLG
ncbi:LysM peptidoglycan-binding domain-containing protein [Kitasatospora camelliae]|uniref:Transglycosylase family protein n=1 Tax=Kitasatospora camelliae TaxID=3156397 RepID=A0AAU8JRW9_9ACTN